MRGTRMKTLFTVLSFAVMLLACASSQKTCRLRAEVYYPVFDGLLGQTAPVRLLLRFPSTAGESLASGQPVHIAISSASSEIALSSLNLLPLNVPCRTPLIDGQVIGRSEDGQEVFVKIQHPL